MSKSGKKKDCPCPCPPCDEQTEQSAYYPPEPSAKPVDAGGTRPGPSPPVPETEYQPMLAEDTPTSSPAFQAETSDYEVFTLPDSFGLPGQLAVGEGPDVLADFRSEKFREGGGVAAGWKAPSEPQHSPTFAAKTEELKSRGGGDASKTTGLGDPHFKKPKGTAEQQKEAAQAEKFSPAPELKKPALSPGGKAAVASAQAAKKRFGSPASGTTQAAGDIHKKTQQLAAQAGIVSEFGGPGGTNELPGLGGPGLLQPFDVASQKSAEAYAAGAKASKAQFDPSPKKTVQERKKLEQRQKSIEAKLGQSGASSGQGAPPGGGASNGGLAGATLEDVSSARQQAPTGADAGSAPYLRVESQGAGASTARTLSDYGAAGPAQFTLTDHAPAAPQSAQRGTVPIPTTAERNRSKMLELLGRARPGLFGSVGTSRPGAPLARTTGAGVSGPRPPLAPRFGRDYSGSGHPRVGGAATPWAAADRSVTPAAQSQGPSTPLASTVELTGIDRRQRVPPATLSLAPTVDLRVTTGGGELPGPWSRSAGRDHATRVGSATDRSTVAYGTAWGAPLYQAPTQFQAAGAGVDSLVPAFQAGVEPIAPPNDLAGPTETSFDEYETFSTGSDPFDAALEHAGGISRPKKGAGVLGQLLAPPQFRGAFAAYQNIKEAQRLDVIQSPSDDRRYKAGLAAAARDLRAAFARMAQDFVDHLGVSKGAAENLRNQMKRQIARAQGTANYRGALQRWKAGGRKGKKPKRRDHIEAAEAELDALLQPPKADDAGDGPEQGGGGPTGGSGCPCPCPPCPGDGGGNGDPASGRGMLVYAEEIFETNPLVVVDEGIWAQAGGGGAPNPPRVETEREKLYRLKAQYDAAPEGSEEKAKLRKRLIEQIQKLGELTKQAGRDFIAAELGSDISPLALRRILIRVLPFLIEKARLDEQIALVERMAESSDDDPAHIRLALDRLTVERDAVDFEILSGSIDVLVEDKKYDWFQEQDVRGRVLSLRMASLLNRADEIWERTRALRPGSYDPEYVKHTNPVLVSLLRRPAFVRFGPHRVDTTEYYRRNLPGIPRAHRDQARAWEQRIANARRTVESIHTMRQLHHPTEEYYVWARSVQKDIDSYGWPAVYAEAFLTTWFTLASLVLPTAISAQAAVGVYRAGILRGATPAISRTVSRGIGVGLDVVLSTGLDVAGQAAVGDEVSLEDAGLRSVAQTIITEAIGFVPARSTKALMLRRVVGAGRTADSSFVEFARGSAFSRQLRSLNIDPRRGFGLEVRVSPDDAVRAAYDVPYQLAESLRQAWYTNTDWVPPHMAWRGYLVPESTEVLPAQTFRLSDFLEIM